MIARNCLCPIDAEDFSGKPSYQSLANEYIEPPLRIHYNLVTIDGRRVGVFEIGFPGEIIHKDLTLNACDLSKMPSART